jgi:YVTN family beta-propeller protein
VLYAHATNAGLTNDSVLILDSQSFAVVNRIPVGLHGLHLALDPTGMRLYVSNQGDDNVSVIDTGTQKVIATIAARSNPRPLLVVDVPEPPPTVSVIEYYNAPLDHYFMTASTSDINLLDGGAFAGWERTQQTFLAYRAQSTSGLSPVCRFYMPPQHGDSHFFSALPAECAFLVMAAADPVHFPNFSGYIEESTAAFSSRGRMPLAPARRAQCRCTGSGTSASIPIIVTRPIQRSLHRCRRVTT